MATVDLRDPLAARSLGQRAEKLKQGIRHVDDRRIRELGRKDHWVEQRRRCEVGDREGLADEKPAREISRSSRSIAATVFARLVPAVSAVISNLRRMPLRSIRNPARSKIRAASG